jgi:hypothetical protein
METIKLTKAERRAFIVSLVKSKKAKAKITNTLSTYKDFDMDDGDTALIKDSGLSLTPSGNDVSDELVSLEGFHNNVQSSEVEEMFYGFVEKSEKTED